MKLTVIAVPSRVSYDDLKNAAESDGLGAAPVTTGTTCSAQDYQTVYPTESWRTWTGNA